ncbi:MAG: hypothetical protein M3Y59_10190 [Myxococcota bacterium]|nr:hypothetical protein [Myxococcota bacterium]
MLIRYSDWKNPTDGAYAFPLRSVSPRLPAEGERTEVSAVEAAVFSREDAARFDQRIDRWTGPEDLLEGTQPYATVQRWFEERPWSPRLGLESVEAVLRGTVLVLRAPEGQTDFVMRDHHTLDAVLYQYAATGALPLRMFHADRHSDWCQDSFLEARRPPQAATWWRLLEGLKRPVTGAPVIREADVLFTTALAQRRDGMVGREIGASTRVPGCVDPTALGWEQVLDRPELEDTDWVSLDLDYFQPAAQLRLTGGLVRDPRFASLMARAAVRLFVLSPQFARGGDKIPEWTLQGTRSASLRLLNLLRR